MKYSKKKLLKIAGKITTFQKITPEEMDLINSFEKVAERKLDYKVGARRDGDVIAIYANNDFAKQELNWLPKFNLDDMMLSAWKWQQYDEK